VRNLKGNISGPLDYARDDNESTCRAAIFAAVSFRWRPRWPPYNSCFASVSYRLRFSSELRCGSRRFAARREADDKRDHRDPDVEPGVGGVIAD
jgi:hypothetical protein